MMSRFLMLFRARWFGAMLLAGAVLAVPARAADPGLAVMQSATEEIMAVVYDQPAEGRKLSERVRPVLSKYFDFEYATRSAIGPGWRQFDEAQQARAVTLFTDLILRTYADRFEPASRPTIAWGQPVTPAEKRREVPSTITYEGKRYSVAYKLRETSGAWKVYDVIAENVSLIANYRAQFDELFRKGGAAAVLRALEENVQQAANPDADTSLQPLPSTTP